MKPKNVICLSIDRLQAGQLGPYGNTWIETPGFNRLAAESLVFDQALVDSPHLDLLYRSFWRGMHAIVDDMPEGTATCVPRTLSEAGISTTLLTDEPEVAALRQAEALDERVVLQRPLQAPPADRIEATQLATFFETAAGAMAECSEPFLLWLHSRGMGGPWDAPYQLREQYADEEDPQPPMFSDVPCRRLAKDHDPDELLGIAQAYAGQISLLDTCLGAFLDSLIDIGPTGETLLILLGIRGFPLGEHGHIGSSDGALYCELVHVPCMVRFPDGHAAAVRSSSLVQSPDVAATLLDWWGLKEKAVGNRSRSLLDLAGSGAVSRDRACIVSRNGDRAIRTPAWYLLKPGASLPDRAELYAKPDDCWEINEVSTRCGDVVEKMGAAFSEFEEASKTGQPGELPSLDDVLVNGLE